ncbi:RHS repeat domain-containing protein [Pseudomonas rustica]|uniref:RHS repeat domain-containing protein n=1 Tax=Pseudomonas rustica TaxID=2827099 RepID=UPI003CEA8B77
MSSGIDAFTPNLTATDSRGLPVRQIAYWRQDVSQREARPTIQQHDAVGRLVAQQDPRLLADASAPANLVSIYSLSGKVLSTVSVDAGWRLSLSGEADQALLGWDGRGSQRWTEYDDQIRPIAAFEHAVDAGFLCAERFAYGGDNPAFSARNQCGQLIRHDDAAGTQLFEQFGLAGEVLQQTRHFLQTLESPDWPASVSERDTLLEPGAGFTARARFNPLGEAIEQTDAKGNRQMISHAVDGLLHEVRLQLAKDVAPKVLVSAIQYNALGQTVRETAGNGVITSLDYAADDGRLSRLQAKRGSDALQDLRYVYDPVGNVLSIEDAALPIRYFANQRVEPVNRYVYDSLYQLINATGWEAGGTNQGPTFSRFDDPASCANYTQNYRYDRGGNLLELTHDGSQSHGHRLVAAAQSNRCLPVLNGVEPSEGDFRNSFDSSGNLLNLQPGQSLRWDLHNQLREVRPVANDREGYVYGADGMRVRKVRSTQTNARTLISEVRYLPGLELRTHSGTGEALQVITVQAGRSSVRVLHWESEPPKDIANDQYRYSLNDHLGSCALELDSSGDIISQERYHPFGTTAWFAGRSEIEAGYKTVRYSGQERDATGLYYYGFRYYVPWLQRWLNPDPLGTVDGLNLFSMVINNPMSYFDVDGGVREGLTDARRTEEPPEHTPAALTGTPFSSSEKEPGSSKFDFPNPVPPSPQSNENAHLLIESIQLLELNATPSTTSIFSVLDDIGNRPPISGGGEGKIFESLDGNYVYKKFHGFRGLDTIPGSVKSEEQGFNDYYGAGAATAILEDKQVYLKMIKLDGKPLDKFENQSITIDAVYALQTMFEELEGKDLFHQDVQSKNFLYSEKHKKAYPVDMAVLSYELAQYTIDVYNRKQQSVIQNFANKVKH